MANRLQKLALTKYTPGIPYQPAVPAYCVQIPKPKPAASWGVPTSFTLLTGPDGFGNNVTVLWPVYGSAASIGGIAEWGDSSAPYGYEKKCYPAIPEP